MYLSLYMELYDCLILDQWAGISDNGQTKVYQDG